MSAPARTRISALHERAAGLAGATQEEIVAALRREFPGLPDERYYLNPAAMAVMARCRRDQQQEQGRRVDVARLRARGLPEAWAGTRTRERQATPGPRRFVGQDEY
jgi:hypothetical protein